MRDMARSIGRDEPGWCFEASAYFCYDSKRPRGNNMSQVDSAIELIPVGHVQQRIMIIRGVRVITDAELARLYGVSTKRLNEQVKRNIARFPADFMFQLTQAEAENL